MVKYTIKKIPSVDHWFVDGKCGYCVAAGQTRQEAIEEATKRIEQAQKESYKPAWYFENSLEIEDEQQNLRQ